MKILTINTDLILHTLLFVLLIPGVYITVPSSKIFHSNFDKNVVLTHTVIFFFSHYLLKKLI